MNEGTENRNYSGLAVLAEAVQFQFVGLNSKSVCSGHLFLQLFDLAILKFHYFSARGTDEMVVMSLMGYIIELCL